MAAVLKHTKCPVCGHQHHFCHLGGELVPGRHYDYLCPETARQGRLQATASGEMVRAVAEGAVALTPAPEKAAATDAAKEAAGGPERLQEVLPTVKDLAAKVGGMDHLSSIVETLKDTKE